MVRLVVPIKDLGRKAASVAQRIASILSAWDEVESVCVLSYGEDRYDPYFALSVDAYVSSPVRDPAQRQPSFSEAGAFESAVLGNKDRFLSGDIPVRIEYKVTDRFSALARAATEGTCLLRAAGTFAFHRLATCELLFSRSGWFERIIESLESIPDSFWSEVIRVQLASLEHVYGDLQAARAREDAFYFTVTAGRFATKVTSLVFAMNRTFEPSSRLMIDRVLTLPEVPDSFEGNIEHFARVDSVMSMDQRTEIAELMIKELAGLASGR